ncbi:MAG: response regulator [Planctomycetia bacterium]|nr:response regulator [Planctomycetia bacterium]
MKTVISKLRIALVDDDPAQARLYSMILEKALGTTAEIAAFTESDKAAEYLNDHLVDVLITDLRMPNVDGLELIRIAKRRSNGAQVLIMTATSTADSLVDAAELGASDYLLKPFAKELLIDLVEQSQRRLARWRAALAGTFHQGRPLLQLEDY